MFNESLFKVFENIKNKSIFVILSSVRRKSMQWLENVKNGQVISEKIDKLTIYNGEIIEVLSSFYPILEKDKLCGIIIIFNQIDENDENIKLASLPNISQILSNNLGKNTVSYYDFIDIRHIIINNKSKMRRIFCEIRRVGFH